MKLSKQERIAAFVIAIIVILAVGIFVFIKPRFEAIGTTTATLTTKQQEYVAALEKQSTKDGLKTQVLDAYEQGEHLADMFFPELTTYQVDKEFRAFLEQCEANVIVENLNVSEPGTTTLSTSFYTPTEVTYDLKTYVTQGMETDEEELAAQNRRQILQNALGAAQTIGSISVDFTVSAIDQDELLKFCDEVNEYFKDENGTPTRKAIILGGASFSYPLIEEKYDELATKILDEAEAEGNKALYKNAGQTYVPENNGAVSGEASEGDKSEESLSVSDYLYSLSTQITFFSVERMIDPTDQLDAQDGIVY